MVKKRKSAQQLISEAKGISAEEFISGKVSLGRLPKIKKRPSKISQIAKTLGKGTLAGIKTIGRPIKPLKTIGKIKKSKPKQKIQKIKVEIQQPRDPIPQRAPQIPPRKLTANERSIIIQRNKRIRDLQTLDFIRRL